MKTNTQFVEKILDEYSGKKESKVDVLKRLDRKAKTPAEIFAFSFGITMSLVFGLGMCLTMKVIGNAMPLGILVGLLGLTGISLNYPIYTGMLESNKAKYADQILALAKEITEEN